jgi:23S rRNA pseudouridine2605 synthase
MHPKYHKPKVYHVKIRGEVEAEKIEALGRPMVIDGYRTKPAGISVITRKQDYTVLAMELFEGRNRQIRKMCEQLSLHIITLKRISIGDVKLGNLPVGEWRHLTRAQVESLKQ